MSPRSPPPIPQRGAEPSEVRSPPLPPSAGSAPLPPSSPPTRTSTDKRASRLPPPIPGAVSAAPASAPAAPAPTAPAAPTSPVTNRYSRGPPPPPPSQPPRQSAEISRFDDSDEGEEDEGEDDIEEEDEDEEPPGRPSEDLHHAGLPSLGPGSQARLPPMPPPAGVTSPRGMPPPPPGQPPRQSREMPRVPPTLPPVQSPPADDDYDPYNYESNPLGSPAGTSATTPRVEMQKNDMYDASPPTSPGSRAPPPLPPMQSPPIPAPTQPPPTQVAPPPPPPHESIPAPAPPPAHASPPIPPQHSQSFISAPPPLDPRRSLDVPAVGSNRRSVDVSRLSAEHNDYIASDVDVGRDSGWFMQRRTPPPVFANRSDVMIEYDDSTTVQSDGRPLAAKHIYVLFMDYSQTIITATFSQESPAATAEFQQRHEPPPPKLRQDQLEAAHARFGARLAQAAKAKEGHAVGSDGSPLAFVAELIRGVAPDALMPVGNRAFGALVYGNLANASVQQFDEIRAGDVVSFRNARLQGHRGAMKQKYSLELAGLVGFVLDWDGTKQKIRIYEQNGKKVKVESYRLGDLKTGEAKIWRVMAREWVGWGQSNWV